VLTKMTHIYARLFRVRCSLEFFFSVLVVRAYPINVVAVLTHAVQNRYNTRWLIPYFEKFMRLLEEAQLPPPLLFVIFLGANDAVLPRFSQHVPLPEYEANLRYYVDTLLAHPMTKGTKIVLITPPPIDIPPSDDEDEFDIPVVRAQLTSEDLDGPGYRTYLNKKMYAEKVMEIARSYGGSGDLVVGLDFWTAMINYGRAMGKEKGIPDHDERLPGSGLSGAVYFGREVFLDGLHLGPLVCAKHPRETNLGLMLIVYRVIMFYRASFYPY
jgi:hypothetical protein